MDKIVVEAMIDADLRRVWNAWTNGEEIVNWNFASPDWCCPQASSDLRVGGKFTSRMEAKDGSFGFDFEGIFTRVDELHALHYTMPDGRQVEVEFKQAIDGVHVIERFDAEQENPIEMQQAGWQAILNNFKQYVESTK
jgi:uncharacterized protein YndB with AHSA1/START domain